MKWKAISIFCVLTIILVKLAMIPSRDNLKKSGFVEKIHTIEVTAHRGYSELYPENTMLAFEEALKAGTDWIELDVQESKDDKLVVLHNPSFWDTAHNRNYIWNLTYDEIKKINVGHYMQKNACAPTLEEVIVWAKENNAKLNIELKDNEHTKKLVSATLDLVNKYDYKENVVIASMNYDFLTEVKNIDGTFTTVYVMKNLEKPISECIDADIFSINKNYVNAELVEEIHNMNKKVYMWTIITIDEIIDAVEYKVDNIIVNDVVLGIEIKNQLVR